jgi:hypothetical protein
MKVGQGPNWGCSAKGKKNVEDYAKLADCCNLKAGHVETEGLPNAGRNTAESETNGHKSSSILSTD